MIRALPHWPALMDRDTACTYLSLGETAFAALTARYKVAAVDLGPLRGVLWRKADLDAMVDNLPRRGEPCATEAAPSLQSAEDLMIARLEKPKRRA